MGKNVFKRKELKYLLSRSDYEALLPILQKYMTSDKYGLQTVNNVYFDSPYFELISRSIEKPLYKEKVRLRVYNTPTDESMAFFELKKKFKGVVYKRRINTTLKKIIDYVENGIPIDDSQMFKEIDYVYKLYNLSPKIYLAYDRIAYFGNDDKEFRVTFDFRIRYRFDNPNIKNVDEYALFLNDDTILMETKGIYGYPRWLIDFLESRSLNRQSFSKFGKIYQENINVLKEKLPCLA